MDVDRISRHKRSLALILLCSAALMVIVDTTIVTIALPTIVSELHIPGASVSWVLNAYMLTFGGFLLLSGRLADLHGGRRLFLAATALFTLGSLAGGVAHTEAILIAARALQGLAGAAITAVCVALLTNLFSEPAERARAMGLYGFVCAAGGGIGELLGGVLTQTLNWHWIFLVNVPIGAAVCVLCYGLLPRDGPLTAAPRLDLVGAISITTASALLLKILIDVNQSGWTSANQSLTLVVVLLLTIFITAELRGRNPLIPLRLFSFRNLLAANLVGALWTSGSFAWFVLCALYLQRVLGYDPLQAGLAFVPAEIVTAILSAGLSARMTTRFGARSTLTLSLLLAAIGLALFARAPARGHFLLDVLPGMLFLGMASGMGYTALLLAAMSDTDNRNSGIASGLINTSCTMGGTLGLALLTALAETRTQALHRQGIDTLTALNGGYHLGFLCAALLAAAAASLSAFALRLGLQHGRSLAASAMP